MARLLKSKIIFNSILLYFCAFPFYSIAQYSEVKDSTAVESIMHLSGKQLILATENQLLLDYDVKKLPFFCKIEAEVWKGQKLPAYFRLGSMDEVNRLEGKHNFTTYKD